MNKQQLAAKIWASANKMRSKIEANEYKDYILGFIFYKFLSDKEVAYLISANHKKLFDKIFDTLQTGLSKLGASTAEQNAAVRDLASLIRLIPTDGRQDYDVLGFVYEYLISNFAANAGKKAGEFYTPHQVSLMMSEIIAHHLRDNEEIRIYDPTSGSGSLLINIGKSVARHISDKNNIRST